MDELRTRRIGHNNLRAEAAVTFEPTNTLAAAHEFARRAEAHLFTDLPRVTAAIVHTSPAGTH